MNRQAIVDRHNPIITKVESVAPLSVGNGEFGFSCDFTGLQSFPELYESPLSTQSNWGWHYTGKKDLYTLDDVVLQELDTHGRKVLYPMRPEHKEKEYNWLRQNPHRVNLGRVSLRILAEDGSEATIEQIKNIHQEHFLWNGYVLSEFEVFGEKVQVKTASHPQKDWIQVTVKSELIKKGRLELFTLFPCPDIMHDGWAKAIYPSWEHDDRHETILANKNEQSASIKRVMDEDQYYTLLQSSGATFEQTKTHEVAIKPNRNHDEFELIVAFEEHDIEINNEVNVFTDSQQFWNEFWQTGGAIDFSESTDPRAFELERRVVLSQYVCAVHSGGSMPPQETGYMYNSWFGKAHLEMHWWHAAHFPLWGRAHILGKSLDWYKEILPLAKDLAKEQGYDGARWPKMVGIDGKQSPSKVAPGLIWQQPHPISMLELYYQSHPTQETLNKFKDIIFESADFMVSFAHWDDERKSYDLGPPLIPAQECHQMHESANPPYELEYWKYGLEVAIRWAERLGVEANPNWAIVASHMTSPKIEDGVYLAHENCFNTFTEKNHDHPSMVGALGLLPGTLIDREAMKKTLYKVKEEWRWDTAWGWDFPMCAMTAARLGERELAVDFLLMDAVKNNYLPNGHNYQRPGLTAYLPGNGGLLTAIAMMAAGWRDAEDKNSPGFPNDGSWKVKHEGLHDWFE